MWNSRSGSFSSRVVSFSSIVGSFSSRSRVGSIISDFFSSARDASMVAVFSSTWLTGAHSKSGEGRRILGGLEARWRGLRDLREHLLLKCLLASVLRSDVGKEIVISSRPDLACVRMLTSLSLSRRTVTWMGSTRLTRRDPQERPLALSMLICKAFSSTARGRTSTFLRRPIAQRTSFCSLAEILFSFFSVRLSLHSRAQ
mmetsp:Transcript_23981/g.35947  ORF Transcript_23981/g.35947 Transcript_23981/m.35947 type:complete len:200 (-) Transcript_23981:3697-4296(-)